MKLYASVKHTRILTPQLARQLLGLESGLDVLLDEQTNVANKKDNTLESLRELNRNNIVFSDNLEWILSQAGKNNDRYIITFDIDDAEFMKFPEERFVDENGKDIATFTLSAERFGALVRTSKYSEGGRNVIFSEFKKEKEPSETAKSEGFFNEIKNWFNRG